MSSSTSIVQQGHLLEEHRLLHFEVDADFLWRHPSLHEHGLRHVRLLYWWSDAVLPFAPDAVHQLAVRLGRRAVGACGLRSGHAAGVDLERG